MEVAPQPSTSSPCQGKPPGNADKDDNGALELKVLAHPQCAAAVSNASSDSETYATCYTHPHMSPETSNPNLYVNPLDYGGEDPQELPEGPPPQCREATDSQSTDKTDSRVVQNLDDGLSTTRQRSPKSKHTTPCSSPDKAVIAQGNPPPATTDDTSTTTTTASHPQETAESDSPPQHSSSDPLHSQGSFRAKGHHSTKGGSGGGMGRFLKSPFAKHRLHASPQTGRKLANYHVIANSKSGMLHSSFLSPIPLLCLLEPLLTISLCFALVLIHCCMIAISVLIMAKPKEVQRYQ